MKFKYNAAIQTLAVIAQIANIAAPMLPDKYNALFAAVVGLIQAIVALHAHNVNPDGTPAAQPYSKQNSED